MNTCFVVPPQNQNWILDHIAKEISIRIDGSEIVYRYHNLPPADTYWLAHYSILPKVVQLNPHIKMSQYVVFFTHTSSDLVPFIPLFNKCKAVVCENTDHYSELIRSGMDETKLSWIVECSSPEMFKPHERKDGAVLISGSYRRRKNFEGILEVIRLMPERKFIIVTQLLEKWEKAKELREIPNVTIYEELPYDQYPAIYEKCDVYLSMADLEGGGPNALIESMQANLVPVVSDTGNAQDYIRHGYNGFIFPVGSRIDSVVELINEAFNVKVDVSKSVSSFTWESYANQWREVLVPDLVFDKEGYFKS